MPQMGPLFIPGNINPPLYLTAEIRQIPLWKGSITPSPGIYPARSLFPAVPVSPGFKGNPPGFPFREIEKKALCLPGPPRGIPLLESTQLAKSLEKTRADEKPGPLELNPGKPSGFPGFAQLGETTRLITQKEGPVQSPVLKTWEAIPRLPPKCKVMSKMCTTISGFHTP